MASETIIRDRTNLSSVNKLLTELATDMRSSPDFVASKFLQSFFLEYFDHREIKAADNDDLFDISYSRSMSRQYMGCNDHSKLNASEDLQPLNASSIFLLFTLHGVMTTEEYNRLKSSGCFDLDHPKSIMRRFSRIPATEYPPAIFHVLDLLLISKHDFARWVVDTFKQRFSFLEAMEADPEQSWVRIKIQKERMFAARQEATAAGVHEAFLYAIDSTSIPKDRAEGVNCLTQAFEPLAKQIISNPPAVTAVALYISRTQRSDKQPKTLQQWVRSSFNAVVRECN